MPFRNDVHAPPKVIDRFACGRGAVSPRVWLRQIGRLKQPSQSRNRRCEAAYQDSSLASDWSFNRLNLRGNFPGDAIDR
jgi:hypothetical protein